ncbi:hypothetical protein JCM8547_005207 [Rhodosporidiobolus lusitaniae]
MALPQDSSRRAFECIHCATIMPSLYVKYRDPSNTSLSLCSNPQCGRTADVYQSIDTPIVLLDVLLLKAEVYRHLIRNRRTNMMLESIALGGAVLGVEALVSCTGAEQSSDVDILLNVFRGFGWSLLAWLLHLVLLHCIDPLLV